MAWIGSPSAYPPVTPVAADLVPLIQDATGALKTATVASLAETGYERANAQTGTSYTIATGSLGKLLTLSNASAVAVTLPQAGASFPDGWYVDVKNIGAGVVTITPTTSTIDGAATLVLRQNQSARIVSDATNYRTVLASSAPVDSDLLTIAGLTATTDSFMQAKSSAWAARTVAQVAADLSASIKATECIVIACSDETTALTTGTAKVTFRMPYAFTLSAVRASLTTAQATGSIFTVDINESGTTVISTKLTIDNTEKTSTTAATPAVISDSSLADDAEMTVDIDSLGDGTAKGLKIYLIGARA